MVTREILPKILPWLSEKKIILIKGARQVGKTTLLYQIKHILEKEGKQVIYFSIDQELTNPIFSDPKLFITFLKNEYNVENIKTYVLLDEFQYLKSAGIFLKAFFDITKDFLHILVSGSSTLKLSEDKEFLTGRKIEFSLSTFSFLEYLWARSSYKYHFSWKIDNQFQELVEFYKIYQNDLQTNFIDYLNWGGYPEVVLHSQLEKRTLILKEIINTYIKKDIVDFLKIENISGFNNLVSVLSSQIGNLVNKHELGNTLNIHAATLNKYLTILEDTFIFSLVRPFYTNIRKELTKMSKVYVNDFGIRRYYTGIEYHTYRIIDGSSIENYVYNRFKKQFDKEQIFFHRTISKSEVDFVVKRGPSLILVEAKFRNELKLPTSLKRFQENYKNTEDIHIVTKKILKKEADVFYLPAVLLPFVDFNQY